MMKILVRILGINLEPEKIDQLCHIYPAGRRGQHYFTCELPENDPRLREIQALLAKSGLLPWLNRFQKCKPNEYSMEKERIYEPEELTSAEYLELAPSTYIEGLFRDDQGRIQIDGGKIKPSADFARTNPSWIIIPDRVKDTLEKSELRHIVSRPAVLVQGPLADDRQEPVPSAAYGEPWWELTSDLVLPRMSPSVDLRDANGNPIPWESKDFPNGCYLRDGLYTNPEPHYRKQELQTVGPFDVALTFEPFGNKGVSWNRRILIVSRPFREFCLEQGWKSDWVPVRIEEN